MRVYLPQFGERVNVSALEVSEDPDTQVAQTIELMRLYSDEDSRTPEIAFDVANTDLAGDRLSLLFRNVKNSARFTDDAITARPFASWMKGDIVETLVRPVDLRRMRDPQGDCDDFAMTARAQLLAKGIPAAFVTAAVDPAEPGRFSHVYVVADCSSGACGEKWSGKVPLDTSHGPYPGWEVPDPYGRRTEWWGVNPWIVGGSIAAALLLAWWVMR